MRKNTKLLLGGVAAFAAYLLFFNKKSAAEGAPTEPAGMPAGSGSFLDLSWLTDLIGKSGQQLTTYYYDYTKTTSTVTPQDLTNRINALNTVPNTPTTKVNLSSISPFAAIKTAQQTIKQSSTLNIGSTPSVYKAPATATTPSMNIPIIKEPQTAGGQSGVVTLLGFKPTSSTQYQAARQALSGMTYGLSTNQQLSAQRLGISFQQYAALYG